MLPVLSETLHVDFIICDSTGAAADADSTPTVEVFEDATDTAILTPTATKRTGKAGNYRIPIACTTGNGFEAGKSYNVVATATVGGVAGCKAVVARFQVRAYSTDDALRPTTAGRTLDVSATGEAGIDLANVGSPTTTLNLSGTTISTVSGNVAGKILGGGTGTITGSGVNANIVAIDAALTADGTAQAGGATTITLASGSSAADDTYNGRTIDLVSGTGIGQSRKIVDYVGSTRVATVDSAWITNPDDTTKYALGSYGPAATTSGNVTVGGYAAGQDPATLTWAAPTRTLSGTQTFNLTGNIIGNLSGSVGSVTGNVGGNVVGSVGSIATAVTLATSQPNYAPAKAGDAMTLTGAYDAAKTAAQASTALSNTTWTNAKAAFLDAAVSSVATGGVSAGDIAAAVWVASTRSLTDKAGFALATASPTAAQVRQEMDANSIKLANLTGPAALASQIPANFTTATFASAGVFAGAALANVPRTGYALSAAGLDAIAVTDPGAPANHTTLPRMLVALYRRFYGKVTKTTTQIRTFASDGTTVNSTQAITDDSQGNQSIGAAS